MLSEEIKYPLEGGIYPSVVASSSLPARLSNPLPGIRILLSRETVYPFADGFYPAPRRTVVENGQLSGSLVGLDRVKETEGASVPLFRFGFPYFLEVDSSASTREFECTFWLPTPTCCEAIICSLSFHSPSSSSSLCSSSSYQDPLTFVVLVPHHFEHALS